MLACAVASPARGRGGHPAHEPTAHPRVERLGISVRDHPAKSSPSAAVEAGPSTHTDPSAPAGSLTCPLITV